MEKCGACHTLARAGTKGTQGPNLDESFRQALRSGMGRNTVEGVVHDQIMNPAASAEERSGLHAAEDRDRRQREERRRVRRARRRRRRQGRGAPRRGGQVAVQQQAGRRGERRARHARRPQRPARLRRPRRPPHRPASSRSTPRTTRTSRTTSRSRATGSTRRARRCTSGGTSKISVDLKPGDLHVLLHPPRPPRGRHGGRAHRQVTVARSSPARRAAPAGASRSVSGRPARRSTSPAARRRERRSEYDRPETIEETAELVTAAGGTGIAVPIDHLEPAQVADARRAHRRRAGPSRRPRQRHLGRRAARGVGHADLGARPRAGLRLLRLAVDTHLITSHHALPLLLREPGGLLVEVTDGTREYNATHYRLSVFYDLAKESVNRIAWSQAQELGPRGATALAITPGWMRSEMMLEHYGVRRRTGATAARPSRTSASRSRRCTSAARSRRWPPTPIAPGGTARRRRVARSRRSTASPTSTAPARTRGATSSSTASAGCRRTTPAIASTGDGNTCETWSPAPSATRGDPEVGRDP